jgi:predicted nucleic acid-binding protein
VKRLVGIIFLSILLLQVAGSYVYFMVRLAGIREEMREQLKHKPDEQLTLLTLTSEEYRKAKADDHEIDINGKMYDIARMVVLDDRVLVYALHDEAEDNLLALLGEMVKRTSKDKKPVPSQLIQLLTLQFVIIENKISLLDGVFVNHITSCNITFLSFISGIESPPPRG